MEKDQGCLMIAGVKKQYLCNSISTSKAKYYEEKEFECKENS